MHDTLDLFKSKFLENFIENYLRARIIVFWFEGHDMIVRKSHFTHVFTKKVLRNRPFIQSFDWFEKQTAILQKKKGFLIAQ
jgi:hypothetical protein